MGIELLVFGAKVEGGCGWGKDKFDQFATDIYIGKYYNTMAYNYQCSHKWSIKLMVFRVIFCTFVAITIKSSLMDRDINRLKVVLAEKKRTNKWLAEQLGKDPGTVSKWCTNTLQPNLETLVEIAKCLDVDTKDLLWSIKK